MRALRRQLAMVAVVLSSAAMGQTPKVELVAEVVLASSKGDVMDPPSLAALTAKLSAKEHYTSFRRVSTQKLVVSSQPSSVSLPNDKTATLKLEGIERGAARLRVTISPLSTVYTLGRQGSLYHAAGTQGSADVWLVLSAVPAAKRH